MNKTKVLKYLLVTFSVLLGCVLISIPSIIKTNSKLSEYQNKTQSMEQEIQQLKNEAHQKEDSKLVENNSIIENTQVEENIPNNSTNTTNETSTIEKKTEVKPTNVADKNVKEIKEEPKTNTNIQNTNASNTNTSKESNTNNTASVVAAPVNVNPASSSNHYILNKNTKKFHISSCKSVKQMKDSNKIEFNGTREEVISKGYVPCGNCKP